jgi:hypothetical protein
MSLIVRLRSKFDEWIGNSEIDARATGLESLAVDQVAPDGLEMTRAGRRFIWGPVNGVTGIAPVAALPTTAAQWLLWNPDPYQSLVLDQLGTILVSGTAAAGLILLAALVQSPATAGAQATGMQVTSASNGGHTSKVLLKSGVTLTQPLTPNWWPVAKSDSANTAVLSVAAENRDLRGRLIVPPGQGLALAVLSGAGATPLFAPFGMHSEMKLDLQ